MQRFPSLPRDKKKCSPLSLSLSTISYTTRVLIVPNNITSASIRTNKTKKQEKARGIVCARCCLIEYNGHRSSVFIQFLNFSLVRRRRGC